MSSESDRPASTSRQRSFAVRGGHLKSLRMAKGWTQAEAARRADLTDRLIRKAESGGPLEVKSITRLAELYGEPDRPLNPEDLLDDPADVASGPPPTSSRADMLRRWFDGLWNNLDLSVVDELIIPEFEFHAETGVVRNRQEMKDRVLKFRESFSDFDFIVDQVADLGEAVVCYWHVHMTHSGPWLDLKPTGRRLTVHGSSWVQMVGDRFGNAWDFWDPGKAYEELASRDL
jgi:transcriptional regulator with XRE-family HTH domain